MLNAVIASAALLASAGMVEAVGRAIVQNNCPDAVTVSNVPAAGGGYNQIGPQSIQSGGSYSQQYTQLSNGMGWSIKLYKGNDMNDLVQWEYTYLGDGVIWYDLSAVNGDPFNGDWGLSASGGCDPKQTAYRNPTDDSYGMQSSCPDSSSVTVTLCSSGSGGGDAPAPESSPAPYSAPPAAAPDTPSAPPAAPEAPPSQPAAPYSPPADNQPGRQYPPSADAPYAPHGSKDGFPSDGANKLATPAAYTTTQVHTHYVTQYYTVSPVPAPPQKRQEAHLHRHARRHF